MQWATLGFFQHFSGPLAQPPIHSTNHNNTQQSVYKCLSFSVAQHFFHCLRFRPSIAVPFSRCLRRRPRRAGKGSPPPGPRPSRRCWPWERDRETPFTCGEANRSNRVRFICCLEVLNPNERKVRLSNNLGGYIWNLSPTFVVSLSATVWPVIIYERRWGAIQ